MPKVATRPSAPHFKKGCSMSGLIEQFDDLLKEDGPAAIVIKKLLKPVG